MDEREKEIAFFAANVAAGCIPCLNHHKIEMVAAGITKDDLLRIARYAEIVIQKAREFEAKDLDDVFSEIKLSIRDSK